MDTRLVEYHDGDTLLEGYLAHDGSGERKPAVLISHAWAGRTGFENQKAEALAKLGYVGFAMDNYGKGKQGTSMEENQALMTPFVQDRAMLGKRLLSGLEAVRNLDMVDTSRIAAIGFCFGGLCVLDMARSGADLKGVVSFHGLFGAPDNLPNAHIKAKVLALHGYADPMVPPESVLALASEMTEAGADWQIHAYGNTAHAFTNPDANMPENGMQYSPVADNRSWTAMQNFLAEIFA
jgi:dienelactone hydrolase